MRSEVTLVDRYQLERKLGQGGMGEVWQGFDPQLHRPVAVKLLSVNAGTDDSLVRRFEREARIAANLQHPGITAVHDFGRHDERLFLVMELLRGRDLAAVLADHPGGLPVEQVVGITVQTAQALWAAHAQRVVHRDLKPGNLFLLDSGHVKICDFGIARITDTTSQLTAVGTALGTPAFMPPEQWKNDHVDERSDVYALGCVLHALLTGHPPFTGTLPALVGQHLTQPPPPVRASRPDVPEELAALVEQMMAKHPDDRPPSHGLDELVRAAVPTAATDPAPPAAAPPTPPSAAGLATGHHGVVHGPAAPSGPQQDVLHTSAGAGDPEAMFTIGLRHRTQGDAGGAEQWYRRAAATGHVNAMNDLGTLLRDRGETAEAEQWYQRAAATGNIRAMELLGEVCEERRDTAAAEGWYRRAADAGYVVAMSRLGALLHQRGDMAGAEHWWHRAAQLGDIDAMVGLGNLLHRWRGDAAGARYWWQRASATGNTQATHHPGTPRQ